MKERVSLAYLCDQCAEWLAVSDTQVSGEICGWCPKCLQRYRFQVSKEVEASPGLHGGSQGRSAVTDFERLLESLPAAAYTCDAKGSITFFNRRAVELWGCEPQADGGETRFGATPRFFASDGTPLAHDPCWPIGGLRSGEERHDREVIIERSDGSRSTVLAHASLLRDEGGVATGAVNVLVDVTDRKQAEKALLEAYSRKEEFLAILAHELRDPLPPLCNGLHLLRLDMDNRQTLEQACSMMERQLQQIVRLVDELMDVSSIARNKLVLRKERVELATVLRDAVSAARTRIEASGHELVIDLPPDPIYLDADLLRLAQVFSNLLDNAAKYSLDPSKILTTVERQNGEVVVRVRDHGVGIPPDMLERVFDLFTQVDRPLQRAQGGLGVGLSLVKGLVEMHGGTITATSPGLGQGSEFIVRLPVLVGVTPDAGRKGRESKVVATFDYRILVVDDNKDTAISLGMILSRRAREVRIARDGVEAVTLARDFRPHVVLLDIGLPKLNGYEAARQIRKEPWGREMFLIAVTGWGQEQDKRRAAEAGFDLHMVKPVDPVALESLLARLKL
jgi:signal transduction histidine kinase